MAIQQVGGQGVYVITGSGRDPRRTSTGQSWADLLTEQKYMLYKSAYDQALREYNAGIISNKERQRRVEQLQQDIRQERKEIARLERGQLSENERRERMRKREELRLGTTTVRTSSKRSGTDGVTDSGIPLAADFEAQLVKEQDKLLVNKSRTNNEVAKIQKASDGRFMRALRKENQGIPLSPTEQAAYDANIQNYNNAVAAQTRVQTDLTAKQTQIDKVRGLDNQEAFEEYYRTNILKGADPSTTKPGRGGSGGTTSKVLDADVDLDLPDVDYSEQISAGQDRIGDIERQILELQEQISDEPVDVIQRTKEIGRDQYGIGRPRRRLFGRRAEMEALNVEPEPEPIVEETSTPDPVAQEIAKGEVTDKPIMAPTAQRYTVKEGDTLGSVAQQYYGDPQRYTDIAAASGIADPNRIEVGQELIIPLDQPQMSTAPVAEPVVAEPVTEEVVEEKAIAPIQPKPQQTAIGDALRQEVMDRKAREEEIRKNQELPTDTPPELSPFQNASDEDLMQVTGDLRRALDERDRPTLQYAPAPTLTSMPQIRRLGTIVSYQEAMKRGSKERRRPLPPLQQIRAAFDPVRNLSRREKQQVGMGLLEQAKQAYGVSSPEYKKAKVLVLSELGRALDPKRAKQMKTVEALQNNTPGQYTSLGDGIRGLSADSKRIVIQLFPVSDDTKLEEIDKLYKNAQQQLQLSITNTSQKKKALDMLDLMYMAVISDKR